MKIMIAAGGSGGHIFPSVSLANSLQKKGAKEIVFVASKRQLDRNILGKVKFPAYYLSVNPMPFRKDPVKWAVFGCKLISDSLMSAFLIIKHRPDAVVGFGGYCTGTMVKSARFFRVPVVIHEQNYFPGRANVLLTADADRIAVSFDETARYFKGPDAGKVVFTGNPIRLELLSKEKNKAVDELGISGAKKTVLIVGGSQGSSFLNKTVSGAAKIINGAMPGRVQFIHLTGKNDHAEIESFYGENNIPAKVFSFLDRIDAAYAACDLAISRSGAAAIFELAYYGKPMILVPYPKAENSQRSNAEYFSRKEAAVLKEEKTLSPEDLAGEVMGLLGDEVRWDKMSKAALKLARPDAADTLADEVIKLIGNKARNAR